MKLILLLVFAALSSVAQAAQTGSIIGDLTGTTPDIDWDTQLYKSWTLSGNSIPTYSNVPTDTNRIASLQLTVVQPAGQAYTISTNSVQWQGESWNALPPGSTNTIILQWYGRKGKILGYWVEQLESVSGSGGGNVFSTGTPVDRAIPVYQGSTGTNVIPSSVTITGATNVNVPGDLMLSTTNVAGALAGKAANFSLGNGLTLNAGVLSGNYIPGSGVAFSTNSGAITIGSTVVSTIGITVDGGGSTIRTGIVGYLEVPYDCTIQQATMLADQTGSAVIDIWKDTYANYPPTVSDTITASAKPTISSAIKSQDATLTGWNKVVSAGDILAFNVDSATTCTRVTLCLKVVRTTDSAIGITFDGNGSVLVPNTKAYVEVPYNCTITRVTMLADLTGSAVVDIWKDTYANYPPTVADTITASALPTISSANKSQDSTLTGWTKSVTAGDILAFNVNSAATITRLTLVLKITK